MGPRKYLQPPPLLQKIVKKKKVKQEQNLAASSITCLLWRHKVLREHFRVFCFSPLIILEKMEQKPLISYPQILAILQAWQPIMQISSLSKLRPFYVSSSINLRSRKYNRKYSRQSFKTTPINTLNILKGQNLTNFIISWRKTSTTTYRIS